MSDTLITPPVIGTPQNWEEVEQAFASIQSWTSELTRQFNTLRQPVGTPNSALRTITATPHMAVGQLPYTSTLFFGEGSAVWTVQEADVERLNYIRIGQLVFIDFALYTTAISTDTSGSLFIRLRDFDITPGRQQTASNTASPFVQTGILSWNDVANSTSGAGAVGVVGQNFETATRSVVLQLDRTFGGGTSNEFVPWAISTNTNMTGSCWFFTSTSNVPVL